MGLSVEVRQATGKATCKICKKLILKGNKVIVVTGWRTEGQVHNDPEECNKSLR